MATITITIPDEHLTRAIDAIAGSFGYRELIDGEPNPETKAQYSRRKIATALRHRILAYEQEQARTAAGGGIAEIDITA